MVTIVKEDEYKGFDITVKFIDHAKHLVLKNEYKYYTGYVEIPTDHPRYHRCEWCVDDGLEVHGGITYIDKPRFPGDRYILGFDCRHNGDGYRVQDEEYTLGQCRRLVDQLIKEYDYGGLR